MSGRARLRGALPTAVWKPLSNLYWWHQNRGRHLVARSLSPRWRASRRDLRLLKDTHGGERCFILGNGPSLRRTDLSRLKGEFTFGLNRIYLLFAEMGFATSCLVSVNDLVLEQCSAEIAALALPKFITWRARRWFAAAPQTIYIDSDFTGPETFSTEATGRIFEGFTVTYVALQLAFHMGFSEAVLIGVDHNFVTQGPANQAIVSQGEDPNHFSPDYFGKGFKWQLPDLAGSERAYRLARRAYEDAGRHVLDATVGGSLTIFEKADYNQLVDKAGEVSAWKG